MTDQEKIDHLKKQGFIESKNKDVIIKSLRSKNDRFETDLYVYTDEPTIVYINQYKSSGLRTISDGDLIRNHNHCHDNAKKEYLNLMKQAPFLSSGLKDPEPSDELTIGQSKLVPFKIDPMFIVLSLLKKKYETLQIETDMDKSTRDTLNELLYENPLDNQSLMNICEKWYGQHDSDSAKSTISIDGSNQQIDELFDILCKSELYMSKKEQNYLTGMDYDYAVVDLKAKEVMESDFGNHFKTIIDLIDKNHDETFYALNQEDRDAFILSNFDLIGNMYPHKEYYVNSVNESLHWSEDRRKRKKP